MIRRPPRLTRTDTLFPYTPRFRSGDDRSLEAVGERDGAVAEDFGAGDMEDVGCEGLDVPLDAWRDHQRRAIFAAPGNREGGPAADVADRRTGRLGAGGRVDAQLGALLHQIADEAVQRLVGLVPDVIAVAAEHRDAGTGQVHRGFRLPAWANH